MLKDVISAEELEKVWLDMEFSMIMSEMSEAPFVGLKKETADTVFRILTKLKEEGEAKDD